MELEYVIISLAAFATAVLTFFSGFGLGTLLTPVMMLYFPAELAIALTGVVHFFNNLFKLTLVGRQANGGVLLRFGIPAVVFALPGAWLLLRLSSMAPLFSYTAFGRTIAVYPVKFTVALLLIFFALMDLVPALRNLQFGAGKLPLGGALSGFFGGLSGNQGALRSAFLIRAGLSKEAFIGTAVVVSAFVDFTRLGVYATRLKAVPLQDNLILVLCATGAAIAGALLGNRLLKKVTLHFVQVVVAVLLIVVSLALGAGWL
ncbi:MAG TPA: sulfite exporter TauE/SafE family protein [Lacibacter sp.]|nr:sulfite exporter TauE/SafE family protein [Lacibacter sp.]HMO88400.1 sulfite exporter TauE/SafE family protein [Lacibacter sp.]HMP87172.1 sulfite exporter TauE/SafE family protein [Lacibacter sp.]